MQAPAHEWTANLCEVVLGKHGVAGEGNGEHSCHEGGSKHDRSIISGADETNKIGPAKCEDCKQDVVRGALSCNLHAAKEAALDDKSEDKAGNVDAWIVQKSFAKVLIELDDCNETECQGKLGCKNSIDFSNESQALFIVAVSQQA